MDFITQQATATASTLSDLRDRIEADRETTSVEAGLINAFPSELPSRVLGALDSAADEIRALGVWLGIKRAVEDKFGQSFKTILKARTEEAKAGRSEESDAELLTLQAEYTKHFTAWQAIQTLADLQNIDLSSFGEFKAIRKPVVSSGKRLPRNLNYAVNGVDVPGGAGKAATAAKSDLPTFRSVVMAHLGLTEENVGDIKAYPDTFTVTVNDVEVVVTKSVSDEAVAENS